MIIKSGKNPKFPYYFRNVLRSFVPRWIYERQLPGILSDAALRNDFHEILGRVNYYCKPLVASEIRLPADCPMLSDIHVQKPKVYYYDTLEYARYFPQNLQLSLLAGDAPELRPYPAIMKCRPTIGDNEMGVILNLDKVRHFIFLNDSTPWISKAPTAIYRGRLGKQDNFSRRAIMERFLGNPRVDVGDTSRPGGYVPDHWLKPSISLFDHLVHKFILCPEGNDVASNLKWVMSTNTLAVMPQPKWETWFMEGLLEPGRHYVEVKPDFSDLEEKMDYYLAHPKESQEIIDEAHCHVARFLDKRREDIVSLMTLQKYFYVTGQGKGLPVMINSNMFE